MVKHVWVAVHPENLSESVVSVSEPWESCHQFDPLAYGDEATIAQWKPAMLIFEEEE